MSPKQPEIPTRGQRRRVKGWVAPENGFYVGRPTAWGNPWRVKETSRGFSVHHEPQGSIARSAIDTYGTAGEAAEHAVREFRVYMAKQNDLWLRGRLEPLFGKTLLCWCPIDQACHVDVLIEFADAYLNEGKFGSYTFSTWQPRMLTG